MCEFRSVFDFFFFFFFYPVFFFLTNTGLRGQDKCEGLICFIFKKKIIQLFMMNNVKTRVEEFFVMF